MKTETQYPVWLLPIEHGQWLAVGKSELKHIESISNAIRIPTAPRYCDHAMMWHERLLPLFDITLFIEEIECAGDSEQGSLVRQEQTAPLERIAPEEKTVLIAIIAYREGVDDTEMMYGGIRINDTPKLVNVSQSQAKSAQDLSESRQYLSHGALAISSSSEILTPILDVASIFSKSAVDLVGSRPDSGNRDSVAE